MKKEKRSWKERYEALKLAFKWVYNSSKPLMIVFLLFSVLGGLITIIEPYIFKIIIDKITSGSNLNLTFALGIGIAGVLIAYGVARVFQSIFWDMGNILRRAQGLRTERDALHKLMEKITGLDISYFEDPEYYNTLTKASNNIFRLLEMCWNSTVFLTEVISALVIIGALFYFDWRLVIIISLSAIPGIIFAVRSSEELWSAFNYTSSISKEAWYYRQMMTENAVASKEIKSFGLREHFLKRFKNLFTRFIQAQDKAIKSQIKMYVLISIVESTLSVFAAWLVVQSFLQGKITIGEFTFIWAIMFQFAAHLRWTVRLIGDINTHSTFITPIVDVMKYHSKIKEPQNPLNFPAKFKTGIEFKNVTFYYPRAKKPTLKNFNLKIKPNESLALVGENGSGKTTMIKLMCRLYDVQEGEILIDGKNIKEYSLKELSTNIGVIFQDFMKYETLVGENIQLGNISSAKSKQKIHQAAVNAGAWEFIKDLEMKYKTPVGKRISKKGVELSGGQWQKIALSRAFFKDAPVLILDEPTSAVDAKAEYELFRKFENFAKDKITILISHRFSTVRIAKRIVVMHKGLITEQGSHEELLKKKGRYAKLFRLQAKGYK